MMYFREMLVQFHSHTHNFFKKEIWKFEADLMIFILRGKRSLNEGNCKERLMTS